MTIPGRHASKYFSNEPASVRKARRMVAATLDAAGVDPEVPVVVTSELATNALKHAETGFEVSVTVEADTVRIEVQDGAGAMGLASDIARDTGGFGLRLVEHFSTEWGVEIRGDDKAVWVRLPRMSNSA
ncbi:MAG TPA: ATP-binding protein [Acidimicrobiia bacterium]|jgi:anti-sigma regulatory factor (Ser/Thr protein kinase)|nr:ATP-binding protein [Acidimicrobiia bacterium]